MSEISFAASNILLIITVFALCCGVLVLQAFLSTRQNRFVGLILPAVWLLYAVIRLIRDVAANQKIEGYTAATEDGSTVEFAGEHIPAVENFLVWCIVPALLLVIYFICRRIMSKDKSKRLTADLKRPPDGGSSYYG